MMNPPDVEKNPKELTIHGDTRIDNYYWLNERDNPGVIKYLEAENAYTREVMKDTKELQEELYNEIVGRIKQEDQSVPYPDNGYYYYTRYEKGKEYPIYCRKKGNLNAEEEILLNVNELAEGKKYCHVIGINISPDNRLMSYGIDTIGRRKYIIYFKNLETGKIFDTPLQTTTGTVAWARDNKTVFYTRKDEQTLRAYKIFRHILGTEPSTDKEIYHEKDETFNCFVYKGKSKQYIMIASVSTLSNEFRFLPADNPDGEFSVIQPREKNHEYSVVHYKDKFFIRTNLKAKNFRLMEAPVSSPSKENWKELIPHRDTVLFESFEIFDDYLVLDERINGLTYLRIIDRKNDNKEHFIDFGEDTYTAWIGVNMQFDTVTLRFGYSSLTTPTSYFDYNMDTREKALLKQQEVVGDFDPDNYMAERLFAIAGDGTKVPISLVYRKGFEKNGRHPLLLYAYGSYGSSVEPDFSSVRLSLLDRGFTYAIAHIRGGEEMGRYWYEEGKLLKKRNTFSDFIVCAEHLVKNNYTAPDKLFAMGRSAGGLLMGAVVNMRPDLFKGIVAGVPFVDVVTTMLDETLPLTTGEFDEWGNPKNKEYYEYMLSYSPYDNIGEKDYPAMIVTSGLHDSQVQYWEPTKWVAKLRDMKTDNNPLLLHTNMEAGHSGSSGRFEQYRETALEYAFMLKLLEMKD
ncbi:MAG: S9 family peptidase [Bacteroidales bacterium]